MLAKITKTNAEIDEKISPFGWLTLKTSLPRGLTKFKIFFLKVDCEGELRISESNLLHSANTDGKKELRKDLFLTLNWGASSFSYFLFGMNCYLKNLTQINILGIVF